MSYFVLEIIVVSILVSLFATWIKLIPRYPKRKYAFIQQLINTAFLTILLTLMGVFGIYPSWFLLFALILFISWWSIQITKGIVRKGSESKCEISDKEHE